jgi:acyl-CoA synthetase (AMP-forming)/AMP-acid ligase II
MTPPDLLTLFGPPDADRVALEDDRRALTYAELGASVRAVAAMLQRRGVGPGDRVASVLPNSVAAVEAYLACSVLGAIWVGVNPAAPDAERSRQLDLVKPTVVVSAEDTASVPTVAVDFGWPEPTAPCAIGFSSGTTGTPKALVHSRAGVSLAASAVASAQLRGDDRVGIILPMSIHNLMVVGAMAALFAGATCVIVDRLNAPGVAAACRDRQLTLLNALVPATIYDLVHDDGLRAGDLASLRYAGTGAAGLSEELRSAFEAKFDKRLVGTYGMTEAPGVVCREGIEVPRRPGSSGVPLPHLAVTTCDERGRMLPAGQEGELVVGPAHTGPWAEMYRPAIGTWTEHGLQQRPAGETSFRTSDYGWVDTDGAVHVSGRKADVIVRGGVNVNAAELESVLGQHDGIRGIAVIGVADERLGQRIIAYVEPDMDTVLDAGELRDYARGVLAHGKVPDKFVIGALPRNAMGKVARGQLSAASVGRSE